MLRVIIKSIGKVYLPNYAMTEGEATHVCAALVQFIPGSIPEIEYKRVEETEEEWRNW